MTLQRHIAPTAISAADAVGERRAVAVLTVTVISAAVLQNQRCENSV